MDIKWLSCFWTNLIELKTKNYLFETGKIFENYIKIEVHKYSTILLEINQLSQVNVSMASKC